MAERVVRVGFVGAGENTRRRHIPGLRAVAGVELFGVVNRTPESTECVAKNFGLSKRYSSWQELVADERVDAIVIGTWPNLHCEVTCAALAAGKHVLCEARMARNVAEARLMVQAANAQPGKVAMLVPSPFGLESEHEITGLLQNNFIGDLREVVVIGADDQFHDYSKFLHWRQDASISGLNVLSLGILHETLLRWVPQPTRLFAQSRIFEPERPNPNGEGNLPVTVPDSVQILTQYANGARGIYHFSGTTLLGPGKQIHLYGSLGTIKILFGEHDRVFIGRKVDSELREITIPPEKLGGWCVESEFVAAIRAESAVRRTSFSDGLRYMEFTEAVARSSQLCQPVTLPLL